jgi:hypothetical protein
VGHELRAGAPAQWVRFHSLPESKRYPENESEYAVLLGRHHRVLDELDASLSPGRSPEVLVFTAVWSQTSAPADREKLIRCAQPDAEWWESMLYNNSDSPEWPVWIHVYVGRLPFAPEALDPLLRLAADDQTRGLIIAETDLNWLYHPYDGGADVIAPTSTIKESLRIKFAPWLSAHPEGL